MNESEHSESPRKGSSKTCLDITTGLGWILVLGLLMQLLWRAIDRFYFLG